jgi:hypothetical protein
MFWEPAAINATYWKRKWHICILIMYLNILMYRILYCASQLQTFRANTTINIFELTKIFQTTGTQEDRRKTSADRRKVSADFIASLTIRHRIAFRSGHLIPSWKKSKHKQQER